MVVMGHRNIIDGPCLLHESVTYIYIDMCHRLIACDFAPH